MVFKMAAHVNLFDKLLLLFSCYLSFAQEYDPRDYMRREHTLTKPYQGSGMSVPLWDFVGNTLVTNSHIRLTSDHQSIRGAIWNTVPCHDQNWEVHVNFKVHGSGKTLFGDGFAIWYTKERLQMGGVFGNIDIFTGLAIFLDTYSNHNGPHNHQHPYISAMVNNGTIKYDHDDDGTHTQLAGCEAHFRNKNYDTHVAVRYHLNALKVSIDIDNKNEWKECFIVKGVKLPVGYYFGISAATGDLADNHDIISVKFYELDTDETKDSPAYTGLPEAKYMDEPRDRVDDNKGSYLIGQLTGWKLLIVIILVIIGLCVCGVVGFVVFQKRQENSRKRFY